MPDNRKTHSSKLHFRFFPLQSVCILRTKPLLYTRTDTKSCGIILCICDGTLFIHGAIDYREKDLLLSFYVRTFPLYRGKAE